MRNEKAAGATGRPGNYRDGMDDLAARRDALRQAATAPGADPRSLLDAALIELDGAIDALAAAEAGPAGYGGP